jgi:multicomponent Na+:H+ antiporter subunit E
MVSGSRSSLPSHAAALAWRLALFTTLWLILCGGRLESWPFGLPAVSLAAWLHLRLAAGRQSGLRPLMLLWFLPFFFTKSLGSGLDVMVRVFHPRLPIDPALLVYPFTLRHQGCRILLANCITLLPGTISAQLVDDAIIVHTLDKGLPVLATIRDLEERIAKLYGVDLGERRP